MFEVKREMFHQEMAEAVFAHLHGFLLEKENNHCQRVEFLPVEVMRLVCEQVSNDAALKKHGVEAFVLGENAINGLEIETGALIEKRPAEIRCARRLHSAGTSLTGRGFVTTSRRSRRTTSPTCSAHMPALWSTRCPRAGPGLARRFSPRPAFVGCPSISKSSIFWRSRMTVLAGRKPALIFSSRSYSGSRSDRERG